MAFQIVVSDTRASSMGLESDDLGSTNTSERSNNSRDTTRNSFIPRLFPWLRNSSRVSNEESRHNHLYDNHSVTIPDVEVNSTVNSSFTASQVTATSLRGRCASGIQKQTAGQREHPRCGCSYGRQEEMRRGCAGGLTKRGRAAQLECGSVAQASC